MLGDTATPGTTVRLARQTPNKQLQNVKIANLHMLEHSKSEQKGGLFKPSVLMLQQRPSVDFHRGSNPPAYSHVLLQSSQDKKAGGQKSRQYGQEVIRKKAPTPKAQRVVRTPSGARS